MAKSKAESITVIVTEYVKMFGKLPNAATLAEFGITTSMIRHSFKSLSNFKAHFEQELSSELGKVNYLPKSKKIKLRENDIYIISSHQNNTGYNQKFVENLLALEKDLKAQLVIIPTFYETRAANKYKLTLKPDLQDSLQTFVDKSQLNKVKRMLTGPTWSPELSKYYVSDPFSVTDMLDVLVGLHTNATATDPLSGLTGISGEKSAIIVHPKVRWQYVPTPPGTPSKVLMTTGSISDKNYTFTKAGAKGAFHHTNSALVIYKRGDTFWPMLVNADASGSFFHLDKYYTKGVGTKWEGKGYGLVVGDLHCEVIDESVLAATWTSKTSLVKSLPIMTQVFHDMIDFNIEHSHHNKNDLIYRHALKKYNRSSAVQSINKTCEVLDKIITNSPNTSNFKVVSSNHHDHIYRFLNETSLKHIHSWEDQQLYVNLLSAVFKDSTLGKGGDLRNVNILQKVLQFKLLPPIYQKLSFLGRNESFLLYGVDCSQHGDRGPNGSRGGLNTFAGVSHKTTTGHSHTAGIKDGAMVVGHSSNPNHNYNSGYSSWTHSHALHYPNGKRTLITIIDGQWLPGKGL